MRYAEVSVNSPAAQRRTFSYSVPSRLNVLTGQAVLVPFGEKELQGIVMELNPQPAVEDTREIIDIIEPEPLLSPVHIKLARWISDYYLSPLFETVGLMLPPGLGLNAISDKALQASKSASLPRSFWDWNSMLAANKIGFFPYTPATNLLYGLEEAIAMLEEEGLPSVFARHDRHAEATRKAVQAWDLRFSVPTRKNTVVP